MSTQVSDGIPLTLVAEADRKHFRLLELPAEILALLTSDSPPILELKSSGKQGDDDAGTAVLCTPDKTFNLRQKNSSNTVYLLQPHESPDLMSPSLHAIAQCHSSLELTALKASGATVADHMKAILPMYTSAGLAPSSSLDKDALFNAMPFSNHECEEAFGELAAFVQPDTGHVYRPSAALVVQIWQDILNEAIAQGLDLARPMSKGVVFSVTSSEIEVETAIAMAILQAFASSSPDGLVIDEPDRCASWLGRNLLEAEAAQAEVSSKIFLEKWKDLLPEKWRSLADVSKLAAFSQSSDGGKSIMPKGSAVESAVAPGQTTTTAAGNKRKWHEKFRPSKK